MRRRHVFLFFFIWSLAYTKRLVRNDNGGLWPPLSTLVINPSCFCCKPASHKGLKRMKIIYLPVGGGVLFEFEIAMINKNNCANPIFFSLSLSGGLGTGLSAPIVVWHSDMDLFRLTVQSRSVPRCCWFFCIFYSLIILFGFLFRRKKKKRKTCPNLSVQIRRRRSCLPRSLNRSPDSDGRERTLTSLGQL